MNRQSLNLFFLVAMIISAPPSESQARGRNSNNQVMEARALLRSFYPALQGKHYYLTLETAHPFEDDKDPLAAFELYIGEGRKDFVLAVVGGHFGEKPPSDYHSGPVYPKQFLKASFYYDKKGNLVDFSSSGDAIGNGVEFDRVYETVQNHPKFGEDEIAALWKQSGAKYGPQNKDAFLKDLPVQKLEQFLGKITDITTQFGPRKEDGSGPPWWGMWIVKAKTKRSGLVYEMVFEPFNGDLISIMTIPWPPKTLSSQ